MKKPHISCSKLPLVIAGIFLFIALSTFILGYWENDSVEFPSFGKNLAENKILFYLNFYVPFFLFILSLLGILFFPILYQKYLSSFASFVFSVLSGYILNDLFTIKFCIYAAYIIINAIIFTPLKSILVNGVSILLYTVLLFRPSLLGAGSGSFIFADKPQFIQIFLIVVLLGNVASLTAYIKFLSAKISDSQDTVKHLDSIITQLTAFNHRLQEYTKTSGEEAIKKDRLRFTRDLHDRCGYVFTLIITLVEAAISFGDPIPEKVEAALEKIRKQAKEGLMQTRETLYMIREIQGPWDGSIDVIYKMKSIFEDITGIKVDVEFGNVKQSYSKRINNILTKILQEAFTNSIRHGKASYIFIHFWESTEELTITVTDNGIGSQNIVKKIGLAGMEERLDAVGGHIEVSSLTEGGFRIRIRIPITALAEDENITMEEVVNSESGSSYSLGR